MMTQEPCMLQERIQLVQAKIQTLITQWSAQTGQTLPDIQVKFDLRGRVAGWAGSRGGRYFMRFNTDMMQNAAWTHVINNTVPHELAHVICFVQGTDSGHGRVWVRTCRSLGGNGERCHSEAVTYAKGKTYVYTTHTGRTIHLSSIKHKKIQQGASYTGRNGLGRIDSRCAYHVLGQTVQPVTRVTPPVAAPRVVSGSRAAQVRAWIVQGLTQAQVYELCRSQLAQTDAQARQYWRTESAKVGRV
jgi:predicted SprT family Zn-dependent metalloprotease